MKSVIHMVVRVEYDWVLNCTSLEDKIAAAIDLAINPNLHSVENGVSLHSVHIEPVEPHQPILDWDKLEHNPAIVYA